MNDEPDKTALTLLREIQVEIASTRADLASIKDVIVTKDELSAEFLFLRADVASNLLTIDTKIERLRRELHNKINGARRANV